jgi:hypothetical protein
MVKRWDFAAVVVAVSDDVIVQGIRSRKRVSKIARLDRCGRIIWSVSVVARASYSKMCSMMSAVKGIWKIGCKLRFASPFIVATVP